MAKPFIHSDLALSLKATNFKCFGDDPQGFEVLKHVNVLIGRNNSGKSALLDLVEQFATRVCAVPKELWVSGKEPCFQAETPVSKASIDAVSHDHTLSQHLSRCGLGDATTFAARHIAGRACIQMNGSDKRLLEIRSKKNTLLSKALEERPDDATRRQILAMIGSHVCSHSPALFKNVEFRRIAAERNILPEKDYGAQQKDLEVKPDGSGCTALLQSYLNHSFRDRSQVESVLLGALNSIAEPDSHFSRIACLMHPDGKWEIHLEEETKGWIRLTQSGSGLKTIILTLVNLLLIPHDDETSKTKQQRSYVYAFEELENNLHPALLRRLLVYATGVTKERGSLLFVTTHSSATIDLFSRDDEAQIMHVSHDRKRASVAIAKTYINNCDILDDLDVRASDALQANGIIWVEGPSDRIYLNRWIDLWSGGTLKEMIHYQCVFYGGRLLSHLEASSPEEVEKGVAILTVARNAHIVIDSDKDSASDSINATKARMAAEISNTRGVAWITAGNEIENYVPLSAFASNGWQVTPGQYDDVFDSLETCRKGLGKRYLKNKPSLAEALVTKMTLADCKGVLDLDARMQTLCNQVCTWNGIKKIF